MQQQHKHDRRKLVRTKTPGIYRRGESYVVIGRDSRGKQVKRFARTLAEARVAKSELRTDVHRGEYRALSRVTFEAYATDWLDTYTGRTRSGVRAGTLAGYRSTIEREAMPFFGRKRLAEIEPRDVKRYVAKLAARTIPGTEARPARPVSPNTVRLALAPVRALFATALEDGLIRSNPTLGVRIPSPDVIVEEGEQVKALTEDELRALLDGVPGQWRLLHEFLAHTGLRIGETLALQWKHIDFGKRRVMVRRRWYRGDFAPPKSRYGRRDVPLTTGMAHSLWERRKAAGGDQDALVFPSQTGGVLNSSNLFGRVLKPAAKKAGVPWAGFHTLRHTCATTLFRNGLNAKQVQIWLGHHSPAFTMATYVHLLPDDLGDAAFLDALTSTRGTRAEEIAVAPHERVALRSRVSRRI
jgi:integrase